MVRGTRIGERGLSPAVASVLLIVLTVVAVGVLAWFLGLIGPGAPPVSVAAGMSADSDNDLVYIRHNGGDTLDRANLVVRGSPEVPLGTGKFAPGQTLEVSVPGLEPGDEVRLVYVPAGQVLARAEARGGLRPPEPPELVSPENGALLNDRTVTFEWTEPEPGVVYHIQVSDTTLSLVVDDSAVPDNSHTCALPSDGAYRWRVRAQSASGLWSGWSETRCFTVDATPPPAPVLVSPADGSTLDTHAPAFDWTDVSDPSGVYYRLEIVGVLTKSGLVPSGYTLMGGEALGEGTYSWRVRAVDGLGNTSEWSGTWGFTVLTSGVWVQTTRADFESGTLENLDTSTSPGDVLLGTHDFELAAEGSSIWLMLDDGSFYKYQLWGDWTREPKADLPPRWIGHYPSGVLVSSVFDADREVEWGTISWDSTCPSGTSITMEVDLGGGWVPVSNGEDIPGASRTIRYRATMTTTDPSVTPFLHEVRVRYEWWEGG